VQKVGSPIGDAGSVFDIFCHHLNCGIRLDARCSQRMPEESQQLMGALEHVIGFSIRKRA
jgi:hypothetical protein